MSCPSWIQVSWVIVGLLCSCQSARHEARKALAKELANREANRVRSMQLYRAGALSQKASRLEEAAKRFAAAVEADGDNVYAWMALGAVKFDQGDYYGAAEAFHRCAQLAPMRYEPHFNAGTVYETVGRYDQAIKAYENALQLQPNQLECVENLARTYIRANRELPRAQELIQRALLQERRPEWRHWLLVQSVRLSSMRLPEAENAQKPEAENAQKE